MGCRNNATHPITIELVCNGRKPPKCRKSLINFITYRCCFEYKKCTLIKNKSWSRYVLLFLLSVFIQICNSHLIHLLIKIYGLINYNSILIIVIGCVALFRQPITPTTHYFDSPLLRRPIFPTMQNRTQSTNPWFNQVYPRDYYMHYYNANFNFIQIQWRHKNDSFNIYPKCA
jgi:hypothetical protein